MACLNLAERKGLLRFAPGLPPSGGSSNLLQADLSNPLSGSNQGFVCPGQPPMVW